MSPRSLSSGREGPLAIDVNVESGNWPDGDALTILCRRSVDAAMLELAPTLAKSGSEVGIIFTDDASIRKLNAEWRGKDKPTNVLSFPAFPTSKAGAIPPMLGDIVLAWETVQTEAHAEGKPLENHMSHLVVHGLLHLLGYDHETEGEAEEMEDIERRVLARLAIPDPYA